MSFSTSLPPEECRYRLTKKCGGFYETGGMGLWWGGWPMGGDNYINPERPPTGTISEQSFRLFLRIPYGNGYQTCAYGRFRPQIGWTQMDVRFGLARWTKRLSVLWFGFMALVTIVIWCIAMTDRTQPKSIWLVVGPFAMFAFAAGLHALGRWLARDEERRLRVLLPEILQSREAYASPSPIE
jgi:hypothetical protein